MKRLKNNPQTLGAYKRLVKEKLGENFNFNNIIAHFDK